MRGPDEHGGVRVKLGGNNVDDVHHASNAFSLKWGETIGNPECPLMQRWVIETPIGSVRVHHFIQSDDDRSLHDHPWWFLTFPFQSYLDIVPCGRCGGLGYVELSSNPNVSLDGGLCEWCGGSGRDSNTVRAWRFHFRPAHHIHAVATREGCWTFIVTGRKLRHWGFWKRSQGGYGHPTLGFFESRKYFGLFGHAPCE